jgi:hypothetical protein
MQRRLPTRAECFLRPAESRVCGVASRKTHEHDVLDHRLERRRQTDNVAIAIGQEGDDKSVWQQTIWHLWQFNRLVNWHLFEVEDIDIRGLDPDRLSDADLRARIAAASMTAAFERRIGFPTSSESWM